MRNIIKSIPNAITILRIIASLSGAFLFTTGNIIPALLLYIFGGISDFLDGLAARKLNAFSEFGRKLDAFSDKIYAASLLIPSILCGNLLMLIPLALEIKISSIIINSEKEDFKPETQRVGKIKTALLFPTIILGLLATIFSNVYPYLWVLIPWTTILQTNSIISYKNLLNYNLYHKNDIVQEVDNKNEKEVDNKNEKELNAAEQKRLEEEAKAKPKGRYAYRAIQTGRNLIDELVYFTTTQFYELQYDNGNSKMESSRNIKKLVKG